jgi:hypothetical protein
VTAAAIESPPSLLLYHKERSTTAATTMSRSMKSRSLEFREQVQKFSVFIPTGG